MSIGFNIIKKDDYLLIKTHGEGHDIKAVINFADEVIKCCKESNYSSILLDERDREYNLTTVEDQSRMANFLCSLGITDLKIAFVCQQKYQEQIHFLEAAVQNRGLTIRFFMDTDSAEKWLA